MANANEPRSPTAESAPSAPGAPHDGPSGAGVAEAERSGPASVAPAAHSRRKWTLLAALALGLALAGYFLVPAAATALNTVSTDDAYVNSHVTFVAPRVAGQVTRVLVDDNNRVRKGDLLVQLDKEPYQVQVDIKKAAVVNAQADLTAAQAQVRGQIGQVRANRFKLDHAIEDVNNQVALLRARVASLQTKRATLQRAQSDFERARRLFGNGAIGREEYDQKQEAVGVADAQAKQALQEVYETRAGLGLPSVPDKDADLAQVPPDLDQTFSAVKQALAELMLSASQIGYFPTTWNATPKETIAQFYKQDPEGNLDRIYARIIPNAPAIKQAEAKLLQARRDLDQAELNLRYCDILSEIDGVVTRRNINPGNNVQVGQSLMAIRSLTEIWIDANFKETQLAPLRIGQRVRVEVDMYGGRREYEGRITGFTMGTGSTLALLPAQNATGNFIKIVQRLPVRIELTDYDPEKAPLFVGLSVVPYVYYKEPPTGPNAGALLQPAAAPATR